MNGFYMFKTLKLKSICIFLAVLLLVCVVSGTCVIFASEEEKDGIALPVIMYHSILKDPARAGKYVVSPDLLRSDLEYLKNNGYTTVLPKDLIRYVKGEESLPEKPVMITFDDGYLNNLTYAVPILEQLDMCAVISPVGKYTQNFSETKDPNPNYAHMSWDEIKEAEQSGRIEIANHSYDMHNQDRRKGCKKRVGESEEDYKSALAEDIGKMQSLLKENCNLEPKCFTYPYGAVCETSIEVLKKMGFEITLGCTEKMNYIKQGEDMLWCLGRYNRPSGVSTENFMKKVLSGC